MAIDLKCPSELHLHSEPELISRILENLLLNVLEAGGDASAVRIAVETDETQRQVTVQISGKGSGISEDLLPDALFAPLKTTKPHGSGIGLWQVEQLVSSLNGTIQAENLPAGGAGFSIRLPP